MTIFTRLHNFTEIKVFFLYFFGNMPKKIICFHENTKHFIVSSTIRFKKE